MAMLSSSDMHIDQAIKPQHRLVATFESRCKYCICCQKLLIKTKSGWGPKTRYQCEACNVPLCKGGRTKNCFDIYHSMLFGKRYTSSSDQQSICHSTYDQQYISHSSSDQQYSNASSADHQQISDSSFDQRYFSPSISNQQHIRKSSFD
ncbi:hypothetical protein KUTeg_023138 [Tegillarca granosa]|uniref:PiggyBac transposable element-derived protein 4 C-terminal zinc-finger domain-containing protein n=1 Tax=Tegillarca granosa TaxID=220873 RepID=A0ABQ9E0T0_TEGGR|nr:hypothetical protein KUTeg_023138 [Tegillarca granosa]